MLEMLSLAFLGDNHLGVLSGCESLCKLEVRDCPFGNEVLLSNVCILLAQKLPGLNVEVIDGRVIRTPRQESFHVYHYVSVLLPLINVN
ncbi:hypothetical protein H5410_029745 [Solanum commersonii]|uniref:Uncharacterized protein n=1 Tax=Solanum commersonii TaxID=4109 RepID=A0A9J5YEX3_SOLCO|nr:hypothetical protein H5410_029745 [Solanum commersonii]